MPRRPLVAGNWKMNKTHNEGTNLTQNTAWRLEPADTETVDVAVFPPFTALRSVGTIITADRFPFALGAQDCHPEAEGAYTGEISAPMLAALNCSYVIVGHSERRAYFGEDDELVNRKARAVQAAGMTPLVCVGETLEEREAGRTEEVVGAQVRGSLAKLFDGDPDDAPRPVVAYEPVWAIGTGRTATPEDAQATVAHIRTVLREMIGAAADDTRILYGGSVKPGLADELIVQPDIDGFLVGGASLKADAFARLVKETVQRVRMGR